MGTYHTSSHYIVHCIALNPWLFSKFIHDYGSVHPGNKSPSAPMKVYDHQKTSGQKLLTNFDDEVRATADREKKGRWTGGSGKRKHDERSIEQAAAAGYNGKARKPLRTYGAPKGMHGRTGNDEYDDEDR